MIDWDDFSDESDAEVDHSDVRSDFDPWVEAGGSDAGRLGPWDLEAVSAG